MPIESGQVIGDFNTQYPLQDDDLNQGDDHLRLIKRFINNTFLGASGTGFAIPIIATEVELNYLQGLTSAIQAQLDSIRAEFVAKNEGDQEVLAKITVKNEISVKAETGIDVAGLAIRDENGDIRGTFNYYAPLKSMQIFQQGDSVTASPDTEFALVDGVARVIPRNGLTGVPVRDTDLANKKYVDDFLSGTTPAGDLVVDGTIECRESIKIKADTDSGFDGIGIEFGGVDRFVMYFDEAMNELGFAQRNQSNSIITNMIFRRGLIEVTGQESVPTEDLHLANKLYVDTQLASAVPPLVDDALANLQDVEIGGVLTCHEGIKVISDTANGFNGVEILHNGVTRGSFFFEEATGKVGMTDHNSAGVLKSAVFLSEDGCEVYGGKLICHEGLAVIADTNELFNGMSIDYLGVTRAAFYFEESTGDVGIVQKDAFDGAETVFHLSGGKAYVNGSAVPTSMAATSGATGSFVDANNKTITVVDGVITDLG